MNLLLRREKGWSQGELAKRVEASREIIGKYERNENSPSIEMAIKIAKTFDITVDFLLGQGDYSSYDKKVIERIEGIQGMDNKRLGIFFLM